MSDNTGGSRPGIFEDAARKLNMLQPEFVMSVGDLVPGYTEDAAVLTAQKAELDRIVTSLQMPFFRVPGNHDVSNRFMTGEWERTYGRLYYSFVYRNVLFMCLDAQTRELKDGSTDAGLGADQLAWARRTLQSHARVRWTFVFMHQPLWVYEEEKPGSTDFPQLREALAGRNYTIFTGHLHNYAKYTRAGAKYFILATTGGGSELRGPEMGEFDEVVWVTMRPEGPRIANLMLNGILDENVRTEEHVRFADSLKFRPVKESGDAASVRFVLSLTNPFEMPLQGRLTWTQPEGSTWTVLPDKADVQLAAGQKTEVAFSAQCKGDAFPLPSCAGLFELNGRQVYKMQEPMPIDLDTYLHAHRRMAQASEECAARTRAREAEAQASPAPPNTVIVVEGRSFSDQGSGQIGIARNKQAVASGACINQWDAQGHWLEWTFDVPADGYYNLTLCYCSAENLAERQIRVAGEVQEPLAPMVVPATGGWANDSDDWRLFTAADPTGDKPLLLKLKQGKNAVRLTNLNGRGINVDYLAVTSPDVTVTRELLAGKLKK